MERLSEEQRSGIRESLVGRGLTFKPLLEEMCDHITDDIEARMDAGSSFEDSWAGVFEGLPENHFKQMQKDTMETINKRFSLSRVFTYTGLSSLFLSLIFKILHLQFADELLLLSFAALALSLLVGSVSGIVFNRERRGSLAVMGVVFGTLLLLIGYTFRILHLPGGSILVVAGVIFSVVAMVLNTLYSWQKPSVDESLLVFLHEKYSPGIARFLLLMLFPIILYRLLAFVFPMNFDLAVIILIIAIYAAGLQFIALCWSALEREATHRRMPVLLSILAAILCLMLPFAAEAVPFMLRLIAVTLFSFLAASLALQFEPARTGLRYLVWFIPLVFTLSATTKLGWVAPFIASNTAIFIISGFMITGIFLSRKSGIMQAYLILALAGYLVEARG